MAGEISRQTFLRGAAGALAAAGAVFGSVRASADPNTSGWDGLSAAIGGQVLLPDGGPQFATAKQVFNTSFFTPTFPTAAIVRSTAPFPPGKVEFAKLNSVSRPLRRTTVSA